MTRTHVLLLHDCVREEVWKEEGIRYRKWVDIEGIKRKAWRVLSLLFSCELCQSLLSFTTPLHPVLSISRGVNPFTPSLLPSTHFIFFHTLLNSICLLLSNLSHMLTCPFLYCFNIAQLLSYITIHYSKLM